MANGTMDVARLRLLREVALRGSIAGAARELGLTPSAVSQQLAVLEREAGTALVDRSPRGVSLTGAGHALSLRAGEVLDVLAAARADLDRLAGAPGGPVSVAAVASAALTFVSAAASELTAVHPGIDLDVTVAEPSQALAALSTGDVDLAVVDEYDYVPLALPEAVVARQLCAESLVLVVPSEWAGPGRPALSDLGAERWVMPPDDAACGQAVRAACRAAGFEPRVRWTSDDMLVLAAAVAAGHGIAVLPRLSVAAPPIDVEIRQLKAPRLQRRLTVVARASTANRPAVATVIEQLAAAATLAADVSPLGVGRDG